MLSITIVSAAKALGLAAAAKTVATATAINDLGEQPEVRKV